MTTIEQFIADNGIEMSATRVDSNPNMQDMPRRSSHWSCTISCNGDRMVVPFSMGPAHKDPPTVADVLDCLASDAGILESCRDLNDFMSDLGYEDPERAEQIFRTIENQTEELRDLLGEDQLESLVFNTERL